MTDKIILIEFRMFITSQHFYKSYQKTAKNGLETETESDRNIKIHERRGKSKITKITKNFQFKIHYITK